jgi:hypothetical protein
MRDKFADFTRSEWDEALPRVMSDRAARAFVKRLFESESPGHGNMFSFSPPTWAALSLVSESCRERVMSLTAQFPDAFRSAIDEEAERLKRRR